MSQKFDFHGKVKRKIKMSEGNEESTWHTRGFDGALAARTEVTDLDSFACKPLMYKPNKNRNIFIGKTKNKSQLSAYHWNLKTC